MPMHGNIADYSVSPNIHVRFKTNGSQHKRDLFDYLLSRMDCDYPFAIPEISKHRPELAPEECGVCGGYLWKMPVLDRAEVEALAAQVNSYSKVPGHLKLKVKHFGSEDECETLVVDGATA